jgi:hypothetical protein
MSLICSRNKRIKTVDELQRHVLILTTEMPCFGSPSAKTLEIRRETSQSAGISDLVRGRLQPEYCLISESEVIKEFEA